MDKINKIYDVICETNDKLISSGKPITPICVFIKNDESELMDLKLNKKTKNTVQANIKLLATEKEVDAYIMVFDANALVFNKKTGVESGSGACIVRILYTPRSRTTELAWYKDNQILDKERFSGRGRNPDAWDVWWSPDIKVILEIDESKNKKRKVKDDDDVDVSRFRYKWK